MDTGGDKRSAADLDLFRGQGHGGRVRGQRNKKTGRGPHIQQSTSNLSSGDGSVTHEAVSGGQSAENAVERDSCRRSQMEGSKGRAAGSHRQSKTNVMQRTNIAAGRGSQKQATPRTRSGHRPPAGWRQSNPIGNKQSKGMKGSTQSVSLTHHALNQRKNNTMQKHGLDARKQQSNTAAGRGSHRQAPGGNGHRPPEDPQLGKKNASKQNQQKAKQKQAELRQGVTSLQEGRHSNDSSTTPNVAENLETRDQILARLEILLAQRFSGIWTFDLSQLVMSEIMRSESSELLLLLNNSDVLEAKIIEIITYSMFKYQSNQSASSISDKFVERFNIPESPSEALIKVLQEEESSQLSNSSLQIDSNKNQASKLPSHDEPNLNGSPNSGEGADASSDEFTECNYTVVDPFMIPKAMKSMILHPLQEISAK